MGSTSVPRHCTSPSEGFSLVEVLISLAITLVVMALVFQTSAILLRIYRTESRSVELTSMASRALDDITLEIARVGYGLGSEVDAVLTAIPGQRSTSDQILLRSNTEGFRAELAIDPRSREGAVETEESESIEPGDLVLVTDSVNVGERAEVTSVESDSLELRSLDDPGGRPENRAPGKGSSKILKLREVHYYLQPAPDGNVLMKEVRGAREGTRVLARKVDALRFEYLDSFGNVVSAASPELSERLSTVRVTLRVLMGSNPTDRTTLRTAVTLDRQSARVDFAEPGYGFRLARYFHPIENPSGMAARPASDWGIILSGGHDPFQDPSYLYSFLMQKRFLEARVESLTWLEEVRGPVALTFGPENGPMAGSLFLGASGLRIGHLARVHPDRFGLLSPESKVTTFDGTEALAQIGGMAFGVDGALYVASSESAKIYRIPFEPSGEPERPKAVVEFPGSPGPMVQGPDGALYVLVEQTGGSFLWRLDLDENLVPMGSSEVAQLPGKTISMAKEPLSGSLFVLLRERSGDEVIVELTRRWLREPAGEIHPVFRLSEFRTETLEGRMERFSNEDRFPGMVVSVSLPARLIPKTLDFIAFDPFGLLYVGAKDQDLVLKFDMDRLDARHAVDVAGVVDVTRGRSLTSPRVRLRAWRKAPFAW